MSIKIIILAAGKGSRMKSSLPKVLQPLAAKPLLHHVLTTSGQLKPEGITAVIGHGSELVKTYMANFKNINYVEQTEQLGTGHAVMQAEKMYSDEDTVLILYGDVPLITGETLKCLMSKVDDKQPLALLTLKLDDPTGYGRIVRDSNNLIEAIVEEKDASVEQKEIEEVNTGIMAVKGKYLRVWLDKLSCFNASKEYYLTDIIAMCVSDGYMVASTQPLSEQEVLGVNNKKQLQDLERAYQKMLARNLMLDGVTIADASRIDIRGVLVVGEDVSIDVNVVFEGKVRLGRDVTIGANCVLKNCSVENGTTIYPFTYIDGSEIGEECEIGPYARIRPGTEIADSVKIGNFVETKKSKIGKGSKISHLSYIGDSKIGHLCNIGAGTITCNYDGVNKYKTILGDNVFIGSSTQLVAPVSIASNVTIGAGSTITKDVTDSGLTLSRAKQISLKNWKRPVKTYSKQNENPLKH